jgi:dTDP-4-dehydrorhamnose reductase
VADQQGCPTYAYDLAVAIKKILGTDLKGIVHAVGSGDCTWHEFACEIVSLMGSSARVQSITTAESNRKARRPPYAVLANTVLAKHGIELPHWKDALGRFMKQVKVEVKAQPPTPALPHMWGG